MAAFVTGGIAPAQLRAAQLVLPPQVMTFALRVSSDLEMAHRQLGDLTVLDLPLLDQLPLVMRGLS